MPEAAVAAGLATDVLSLDELAAEIARRIMRPRTTRYELASAR